MILDPLPDLCLSSRISLTRSSIQKTTALLLTKGRCDDSTLSLSIAEISWENHRAHQKTSETQIGSFHVPHRLFDALWWGLTAMPTYFQNWIPYSWNLSPFLCAPPSEPDIYLYFVTI